MITEAKTIIYLDQNFISDISKLSLEDKKDRVKPILQKVFDAIKVGVDEEKFLSPDGWIHAIETAAESNPALKDAIRNYQGYLGQTSLNPPWEIKNSQFVKALLNFFKIGQDEREMWRSAFRENPNRRMENFKIDVHFPNFGLGSMDKGTAEALQKIRGSGVDENKQYQAEIEATRKHYKTLLQTDYSWALRKYNIAVDKAEEFIDSHEFTQIPNIDIFCQLWSKSLADKARKHGVEGDYNDIEFLSVYMPYCDVIATDNYMKTILRLLKFDEKYNCRLFSMKEDDLNGMVSFLEEERNRRQPANKSLFSILAVMANEKPTYSIKFLQKLNLAQGKFIGTGKYWNKEVYVGVFLLYTQKGEVELPKSEKVLERGPGAFTPDQWAEFLVFGHGFKKIYNLNQKPIEEIVREIPAHLRGSATAILNDDSNFDDDMREHDSYLFYDIEKAVESKLGHSEKYKVRIVYS